MIHQLPAHMVKNSFDSIEEPVADTSQETLILSARDIYDSLSAAQQEEVGNQRKQKLENAVAALQHVKGQNAADELTDRVNALGPVTLDKGERSERRPITEPISL